MKTYLKLNNGPELLKIKTKEDEIEDLKYKTEKHDYENILITLKIDNRYYKKNYNSLKREKVLLIITEILIGSGSVTGSSAMGLINLGAGIIISSSTALLTSIAILITNEDISKLKIRCTKLRDWINGLTLLNEKTLKQSMADEKIDEKEASQLKKIYIHYFDKRSEIIKETSFKVEEILVIL